MPNVKRENMTQEQLERYKEHDRKKYIKFKEERLQDAKDRYAANPEAKKEYDKEFRKTDAGKKISRKAAWKKRGVIFETKEELEKTNLTYIRFPGIDGSTLNRQTLFNDGYISSYCKSIGTSKMIGVGLSHIKLYEYIKENDTHDYALILEDDILVTNPNLDYRKEINDIVALYQNKEPQWDIIRLHSMGYGMGSTAAYIVNLKHIEKFTSMNLHYHIDIQQSFSYNIINLNTLFNTRDHMITYKNPIYNLYFDNQKIGFYVNCC